MEITIDRGAGLDGRTEKLGPVNTETLPKEIAAQVADLITTKLDFFDKPATISKPGGADVIEYVTTVVDGDRRHTVYSNDLSDIAYRGPFGELIKLLEESGATFTPYEAGPFFSKIVAGASRYDLTGDGITIRYLPFAPLNKGDRLLEYSDHQGTQDFDEDDTRRVEVADLNGTLVTVTLAEKPAGPITATLLVPTVYFTGHDTAWSFPVQTILITASPDADGRHRSLKVTTLVGEARMS
jgi:hypothetical protein